MAESSQFVSPVNDATEEQLRLTRIPEKTKSATAWRICVTEWSMNGVERKQGTIHLFKKSKFFLIRFMCSEMKIGTLRSQPHVHCVHVTIIFWCNVGSYT